MEKTQLCGAVMLLTALLGNATAKADDGGALPPATQSGSTDAETAYFLSSSVPEKDLALLMKAAEARHIPVYFRGLVNDSMEQTAQYMMHLVTTYQVQGVQIDPVRFERYGVKAVPALVRRCGNRFDILYGNLAFNDALHLLDTQGDCAKKNGR